MISIKNIPLNTKTAYFYIDDENKVTFSEQVTLIEYDETESIETESSSGSESTFTDYETKIENKMKVKFMKFLNKIKAVFI
jgi:hypothetical protein